MKEYKETYNSFAYKKACNLMTSTNLPINLIANALGFEDALAFSKKFNEVYKISPKNYRQSQK